MNDKRAGFTVSVVENRLYALGGVNGSGRLSSMECYSLEDDRWRYVASVQTGLCDHAQSVYGNLIYVSGGFKEGRFSNQLLAYSPRYVNVASLVKLVAQVIYYRIIIINIILQILQTRHLA